LTPSKPIRATATVARTSPRRVDLTATAEVVESAEDTLGALAFSAAGVVPIDTAYQGMDIIGTAVNGVGSTFELATTLKAGGFTATTGTGTLTGVAGDKVKITNAANALKVGDKIRIEGQVRNVVFVSTICRLESAAVCEGLRAGGHYLEVDEPFVEDEFSTYTNIFASKTMVEKLESDSEVAAGNGDELASCVVTDMRALTSTHDICVEADGVACATATVSAATNDNGLRIVTHHTGSAMMMDPREVDIGDRIRIVIAGGPGATSTAPKWETRTIDSVTYGTDGQTQRFSVSTAYSATHSDKAIYNDGSGTMEVSTCSNRGLCDESTGECACFAGYTDVDCSHQNALSI